MREGRGMERELSTEEFLALFNQLTPEHQVMVRAFVDAIEHGYTGTAQEWLEMEERGAANASAKG